jgi:hypothetical protein
MKVSDEAEAVNIGLVAPAKAGAHNHWMESLKKAGDTANHDGCRRGGTGGMVANFAISSARSRNGAGYLSGLVFSSGSVDRQA